MSSLDAEALPSEAGLGGGVGFACDVPGGKQEVTHTLPSCTLQRNAPSLHKLTDTIDRIMAQGKEHHGRYSLGRLDLASRILQKCRKSSQEHKGEGPRVSEFALHHDRLSKCV